MRPSLCARGCRELYVERKRGHESYVNGVIWSNCYEVSQRKQALELPVEVDTLF